MYSTPNLIRRDVLKGRDVPEAGLDACLRGWLTKNLLQLLLLRPPEPRRVPAHGVTDYHRGSAWSAATAKATHVPSPRPARPSPRQYPGRHHGQRTQSPPTSFSQVCRVSERFFHLMRMSRSSSVMSIHMKQSYTRCSANTNQESRSICPRMSFCLIPAIDPTPPPQPHPPAGQSRWYRGGLG